MTCTTDNHGDRIKQALAAVFTPEEIATIRRDVQYCRASPVFIVERSSEVIQLTRNPQR